MLPVQSPRIRRGDEGVTLVETLVYSALLVGIMVIVGSVLIQTMWVQHHIVNLNQASNTTQTQLESIELAVRNASDVRVLDGGNLLLVKRRSTLAGTANNAVCSGWYFNAAANQLHSASNAATGVPRTIAANANPSAASNWPVLVEGASRIGTGPVFSFDSARRIVSISIEVATSRDRSALQFRTEANQRAQGASLGGVACF